MKQSRRSLLRKRKRILRTIERIERIRRGQLSRQYATRSNPDGTPRRYGPYYVFQSWHDGEKRTEYVTADKAEQMRRDTDAYRTLKDLFSEYIDVLDQLTRLTK